MKVGYLFLPLILIACSSDSNKKLDSIEEIKNDFITTILIDSSLDEGPFIMDYQLRAILVSDTVVSLFGNIFVFAHLPHGRTRYEGKTYVKSNDSFEELTLDDLFPQPCQKEFLRSYCENFFKVHNKCRFFCGTDASYNRLDQEFIKTFVVDHESLIIVFQPYSVDGLDDIPLTVKIPFTELTGNWKAGNLLEKHLPITKNFLSSWDKDNWISDIQNDHLITR